MNKCRACVWGTKLSVGRFYCPFPKCFLKVVKPDANEAQEALPSSAVSDADLLDVLRATREAARKRAAQWGCTRVRRPLAKSKAALSDFESLVQEVLRAEQAGARDGG